MSPQEIVILKKSYGRILPIADQVAALFFARLFELDPSLRTVFLGDMTEQGWKFMQMLGFAVGGVECPDVILPVIRELGLRHAAYRTCDRHYQNVAEALFWTLRKGLGPSFTGETRAVWDKFYWLLAETMKAGTRDGAARQQIIPA